MRGVTFPAWAEGNPIPLVELLELLGERGRHSTWRLRGLEVSPSESAERWHSLSNTGRAVSGNELVALAREEAQLIDGELEGWQGEGQRPWVVIRAIDSTSWDLLCEDQRVLDEALQRFENATLLPP
jgi:hypothetical protein